MVKIPNLTLLALMLLFQLPCFAQLSWYKRFDGAIGTADFTMHLHKTGNTYAGYYYYIRTQQPITLTGNDTVSKGTILLTAYIAGADASSETFTLALSASSLTGEWKKETDTGTLPVNARETIPGSPMLHFDMVYTDGSTALRPKSPESPTARFEASSVWPKEKTPQATTVKKTVNSLFGFGNSPEEIGKLLLAKKKKTLNSYLQENRNLPDSEWRSFPSAYTLDEVQEVLIMYHSESLLCLSNFTYSYTGGAHGMHATSFEVIDLVNNWVLKLDNIIRPTGKQLLNRLIEKYFRADHDLDATTPLTEAGLFENRISANDNFFVTSGGIGFNYTPYEIGPYAMGEIRVFVPFKDLAGQLQPSFERIVRAKR